MIFENHVKSRDLSKKREFATHRQLIESICHQKNDAAKREGKELRVPSRHEPPGSPKFRQQITARRGSFKVSSQCLLRSGTNYLDHPKKDSKDCAVVRGERGKLRACRVGRSCLGHPKMVRYIAAP